MSTETETDPTPAPQEAFVTAEELWTYCHRMTGYAKIVNTLNARHARKVAEAVKEAQSAQSILELRGRDAFLAGLKEWLNPEKAKQLLARAEQAERERDALRDRASEWMDALRAEVERLEMRILNWGNTHKAFSDYVVRRLDETGAPSGQISERMDWITRQLAGQQWRPVSQPPEDQNSLVIVGGGEEPLVKRFRMRAHFRTHWMPIPPLPDAAEDKREVIDWPIADAPPADIPESEKVPLDQHESMLDSKFRQRFGNIYRPLMVGPDSVWLDVPGKKEVTFRELMDGWFILRPNSTDWQPCYKRKGGVQ